MLINDLDTYLTNISKDHTWGDHNVLVALANALEKTIWVITSHEGDCHEVVVEAKSQQGAPILLGHLSENHYVGLQPESDKTIKSEGVSADFIAINLPFTSYKKNEQEGGYIIIACICYFLQSNKSRCNTALSKALYFSAVTMMHVSEIDTLLTELSLSR